MPQTEQTFANSSSAGQIEDMAGPLSHKIQFLYSQPWKSVLSISMLSGITLFVYWPYHEKQVIIGLLSWMLVLSILRIILTIAHRRADPAERDAGKWIWPFLIWTVLVGAGWGSAGLVFYSEASTLNQMTITIALFAVLASSIPMLSVFPLILYSFLLTTLAPFCYTLIDSSSQSSMTVLGLLTAFMVAMIVVSISMRQTLESSFKLRFDNLDLVNYLSEAKERAELYNHQLTRQVTEREAIEKELQSAKISAEAANMAKDEFLATMSHEIRTPLNGILPLLDILRSTNLTTDQKDYLNTAFQSSHHLLRIIDDILDFSKIEAGKLELENVSMNLQELIHEVSELMNASAERRHLSLSYTLLPNVRLACRGDPVRLRQVLTNLVSNAIKFTEQGQISIRVSLHKETRDNMQLMFAVQDTGVGMSNEVSERLFKPFTQADASTTRMHGGTGLGLAICKRIVELMGGSINVKSQLGKGSVFWFIIPLMKAVRDVAPTRTDLNGCKVLVSAVDNTAYKKLKLYLDSWNVEHLLASTPQEVFHKLKASVKLGKTWSYELLIIDVKDTKKAVLRLIKGIRDSSELEGLRILLVGNPDNMQAALAGMGVTDYIDTPYTESKLRVSIEKILNIQTIPGGFQRPDMITFDDVSKKGSAEMAATDAPAVQKRFAGHVLLVEDNPVNLRVAQKLLELSGIKNTTAENGKEAIAHLKQRSFDLILMDCQMPIMDGYQATQSIRQGDAGDSNTAIPIIAMTANAMAGDREKCIASGMDDYISKPLKRDLLTELLGRWLPTAEETAAELVTQDITSDTDEKSPLGDAVDEVIVTELIDIMGSDFHQVLETYLVNSPQLIRQLTDNAKLLNMKAMVIPAHSLKSSSGNFGALTLSNVAQLIEQRARAEDSSNILELVEKAAKSYAQVETELKSLISKFGLASPLN